MPSHACPTCRKTIEYARASDVPHFPFCCDRCRLVDLGRWLDEGFVIHQPLSPEDRPDPDEDDDDESQAPPKDDDDDDAG